MLLFDIDEGVFFDGVAVVVGPVKLVLLLFVVALGRRVHAKEKFAHLLLTLLAHAG